MPPHPPPDATTSTTVVSLFAVLRGMSGAAVADVGPPTTWHLLKLLSGPVPLRLADLATRSGLDASTVSRHVRAMEDDGLLARAPDETDRRAFRLVVTEAGQQAYAAALRRRGGLVQRATRDWDERQRTSLAALLTRLADDLAALPAPDHHDGVPRARQES